MMNMHHTSVPMVQLNAAGCFDRVSGFRFSCGQDRCRECRAAHLDLFKNALYYENEKKIFRINNCYLLWIL